MGNKTDRIVLLCDPEFKKEYTAMVSHKHPDWKRADRSKHILPKLEAELIAFRKGIG